MLHLHSQDTVASTSPSAQAHSRMPAVPVLRRVLIVDDEPLIRWSLAETLGEGGYAVVEAGSGQEALQAISASEIPFDVAVLDLRLPDSSDLALLWRIRADYPNLPVILMTAYGTPDIVQGALDLGAYDVLAKPFEMKDLAELVRRAHERNRR